MSATVTIKNGVYRNNTIQNQTFTLEKGYKVGTRGGYVTVSDSGRRFRILVQSESDFHITEPRVKKESDQVIMERIGTRFKILDDMTTAAVKGHIKALVVVGPPGVGKSFGVERQLKRWSMFDVLADQQPKYSIVKGAVTPIGLYSTLYQNSDAGQVLVFDDCDNLFYDDLSLNLLKAALDSNKRRRITWNSDSHFLRREGIPDSFDFKGAIIFITNLDYANIKSKKLQDHLEALQSRCHYLDLTISGDHEKMLRIRQIFETGELFADYNFSEAEGREIIDFMAQNKHRLRELSLRMCLKLADLKRVPGDWQTLATATCMR